jgi:fatty acid desaturase 6
MFVMRSLFGPLFMHIAVFNHIGLDNPPAVLPWLPRQNETTRNVKPTLILTGLAGNAFLQCHIEHHLFPSFSHHLLKEVSPVVRQFMDEKGYKYRNESYWWCLKNCLEHYHEIFDNRAEAVF